MRILVAILKPILRFFLFGLAVLGGLYAALAPCSAGGARPEGPYNVGYRVLDLDYPGGAKEKKLTVAVWYPTSATPQRHVYGGPTAGHIALDAPPLVERGPYPLLVFSHGYGGGGIGSVFFTEAMAARGWIVASPDHHDRDTAVRIRGGQQDFDRWGLMRRAGEITRSGPEDRAKYQYRWDELRLALDGLYDSAAFRGLIDRGKIAVGGHSLGGFTALGLCGTIPERHDGRVKAVVLFSTGAGSYLFKESELAAVRMPSITFIGEAERNQRRGGETMAEQAERLYRNLSPPKYFLEIKGADHFSFNNRFTDTRGARALSGDEARFGVIRRYAEAFLEKHVAGKGDPEGVLERSDPLLTRYLSNPWTN